MGQNTAARFDCCYVTLLPNNKSIYTSIWILNVRNNVNIKLHNCFSNLDFFVIFFSGIFQSLSLFNVIDVQQYVLNSNLYNINDNWLLVKRMVDAFKVLSKVKISPTSSRNGHETFLRFDIRWFPRHDLGKRVGNILRST